MARNEVARKVLEMLSRSTPVRVLLVDDEPIDLEGRRSLLSQMPSIEVAAAVTHENATADHLNNIDIDVAVLDMWERRGSAFDRYPGIDIARSLRKRHPRLLVDVQHDGDWSGHVTIVAVTRHIENAVLGKRMQEAGIDLRFDREDDAVADPHRLAEVICFPERHLSSGAGQAWRLTEAARELGMTSETAVNALLDAVKDREPQALFSGDRRYGDNAERHRWQAAMREVVPAFGLARPKGRSAGGSRPRGMSFADLRALLQHARGVSPERRLWP